MVSREHRQSVEYHVPVLPARTRTPPSQTRATELRCLPRSWPLPNQSCPNPRWLPFLAGRGSAGEEKKEKEKEERRATSDDTAVDNEVVCGEMVVPNDDDGGTLSKVESVQSAQLGG